MGGAASKAARRYPSAKKAVVDSPGQPPERVYPPAPVGAAEMEVPVFETAGDFLTAIAIDDPPHLPTLRLSQRLACRMFAILDPVRLHPLC